LRSLLFLKSKVNDHSSPMGEE